MLALMIRRPTVADIPGYLLTTLTATMVGIVVGSVAMWLVTSFEFLPPHEPPAAPQNFVASQGTSAGHVELSWERVVGARTYEIYRDGYLINTVDQLSYDDLLADASPSTVHIYQVRAIGEDLPGGMAVAAGYRDSSPMVK